MIASDTKSLADSLLRGRNADGGWGYYPGKASRIEPTCWVSLYLSRLQNPKTRPVTGAFRWVASQQRADGFLDDATSASPNLGFNGLAALALRSAWSLDQTRQLLDALVRTKGVAIANDPNNGQNNTLQAWPWIEGTFSWVEPTSWCLLALKKSMALMGTRETSARIDEAERLLLDRVCRSGGWNYGNPSVLGTELNAYLPTTALALLALQDRRDHSSVQKGLDFLTEHRLAQPSGMALSLTSICLRVYGVPAADVEERLAALGDRHAFFNNLHVTAMALYSLTGADYGVEEFRV